ncbi:hypothetical protein [Catenulispora subtropica]|uniref:Uncharacterized protein n=1 Tax=Catenulispora subtropica TaxID=450798 RepID=A0ABN2STL5_9ACTN
MTKFKRTVIASILSVAALTAGVAAVAPAVHSSHQHNQPVASDMGPRDVVKPTY